MEGTAAVFVTPVLIGLLAEGVFGYTPPVGNQGQLAWTGAGTGVPHETQAHNLKALSKAIYCVLFLSYTGVTVSLYLLKGKLPADHGRKELQFAGVKAVPADLQKQVEKHVGAAAEVGAHLPEGKTASKRNTRRSF